IEIGNCWRRSGLENGATVSALDLRLWPARPVDSARSERGFEGLKFGLSIGNAHAVCEQLEAEARSRWAKLADNVGDRLMEAALDSVHLALLRIEGSSVVHEIWKSALVDPQNEIIFRIEISEARLKPSDRIMPGVVRHDAVVIHLMIAVAGGMGEPESM